ncbi:unnamed protein product [Vitrella brassicaformis CCMP3155]|uniref:Uncharacterized protein n=2 Tax=Vitrella brassicaformis TaxID=1169539 RepID=A0A0G4EYM8_VITBC|nr:unnamed protein product [Vitrella brassicaformis CCMP3155]|eukprot:CEM04467.1 unnamed protein product [Vitrella brassicaformis CCMP3155]
MLRLLSFAALLCLSRAFFPSVQDEWPEQKPTEEPEPPTTDDGTDKDRDVIDSVKDIVMDTVEDITTAKDIVRDTVKDIIDLLLGSGRLSADSQSVKDLFRYMYLLDGLAPSVNQDSAPGQVCAGVTPSLAGLRLLDLKRPQSEGSAKTIKDGTTDLVIPAEMGLDFTFTAVPVSICVTAVQFLLFDAKGNFIDWDTLRDPPYLESASRGTRGGPFTAFGNTEPSAGREAEALSAREAIAGPGTFTLAALPFNGDIEGDDIEVTFSVPPSLYLKPKFLGSDE